MVSEIGSDVAKAKQSHPMSGSSPDHPISKRSEMIYPEDFINKIICGDCLEVMKDIPDNVIDLTVTSPPYDKQRDYKLGWSLDLNLLGIELFRITKSGGVAAVVMQDQTVKGRKTLTSFKTVLDWANAGWGLFETCIYQRSGVPGAWWGRRFRVDHEYIFLFVKGQKPTTFYKDHLKIPAKQAGEKKKGKERKQDGKYTEYEYNPNRYPKMKCRGTIWNYESERASDKTNKVKVKHPAWFPDTMASDLIECFTSSYGAVVLDPMAGSGSTLVAAVQKVHRRSFIGIDVLEEYCEIARERLL